MSSAAVDVLFRPFKLKSLEIANRIVMAPMTRSAAPDGVPGEANAAYYQRRAEGGVGLILSEGTVVERPASRNDVRIPLFHGGAALAGWQRVIDAVHQSGGRMGPQLWHVGAVAGPRGHRASAPTESPSGLAAPGKAYGEAMSEETIADTVTAFAQAAAQAKRLGFDTLEIHGAHGYLIDQFFWSGTNRRTDRYGGATLQERARFAGEIIAAVRAAVGPDFPIILRISHWKLQDLTARLADSPASLAAWLEPLSEAGVDVFHCSQRRFWEADFPEIDGEHGLNFAGWAKKLTGKPTISVGAVGLSVDFMAAFTGQGSNVASIRPLVERMEREEFDLIAVGRALITDPLWPAKIKAGDATGLRSFDAGSLATLI
jgi:2,4-dienoyl-CoA reductase-like NADH-dependent reductase (Old Yellow Enzyme family)